MFGRVPNPCISACKHAQCMSFWTLVLIHIIICLAISELTATRASLMLTITFPPIADTILTSASFTNPRFARKRLVSSFPPTFWILHFSPIPAIVKGIICISSLSVWIQILRFCCQDLVENFFLYWKKFTVKLCLLFLHWLVYANVCKLSSTFFRFTKLLFVVFNLDLFCTTYIRII